MLFRSADLLARMPVKAAAAELANRHGLPRRDIYALALSMRKDEH